MWLSDSSMKTWARVSRHVSCMGYVCCFLVANPWLLLALQWLGWTLGLIDFGDWPHPHAMSSSVRIDPTEYLYQQASVLFKTNF